MSGRPASVGQRPGSMSPGGGGGGGRDHRHEGDQQEHGLEGEEH